MNPQKRSIFWLSLHSRGLFSAGEGGFAVSEVEASQGDEASVAASDGDRSDESDLRAHGFEASTLRRDEPNFSGTWVPDDQIQFGTNPGEIYLARTAARRCNHPATREAREKRAIEFDYPVDASPAVCRIAANTEVDT